MATYCTGCIINNFKPNFVPRRARVVYGTACLSTNPASFSRKLLLFISSSFLTKHKHKHSQSNNQERKGYPKLLRWLLSVVGYPLKPQDIVTHNDCTNRHPSFVRRRRGFFLCLLSWLSQLIQDHASFARRSRARRLESCLSILCA